MVLAVLVVVVVVVVIATPTVVVKEVVEKVEVQKVVRSCSGRRSTSSSVGMCRMSVNIKDIKG